MSIEINIGEPLGSVFLTDEEYKCPFVRMAVNTEILHTKLDMRAFYHPEEAKRLRPIINKLGDRFNRICKKHNLNRYACLYANYH